jgi:predicted DCC family thiol-disulfide oxidoreductase YuxK
MCNYQHHATDDDLSIAFDDLNKTDLATWGVTEDAATRLLHVVHEGRLHIGFDAVVTLWEQMPNYHRRARFARLPIVFLVLSWGYRHIVARGVYLRHKWRRSRGAIK